MYLDCEFGICRSTIVKSTSIGEVHVDQLILTFHETSNQNSGDVRKWDYLVNRHGLVIHREMEYFLIYESME